MEHKIQLLMADEFQKAIKSLAGYKFLMFGYHAAKWVSYNQLLDKKQGNPFKSLVDSARQIKEWIDF